MISFDLKDQYFKDKLFNEIWDLIHLMNDLWEELSITIGIKLWFAPQISEHWPNNKPGRFEKKFVWLSRPGVASTLTPRLETVQEWRTSAAVINIRIWEFMGIIVRLSTSKRRNMLLFMSFEGIIKESNSIFVKSEYS